MSYEFQATLYPDTKDAHRAIIEAWFNELSAKELHAALRRSDQELVTECWDAWFYATDAITWENKEDLAKAMADFREKTQLLESLNCHSSGIITIEDNDVVAVIDSEGDLCLADGCPFTEDEIKEQVSWQMSGTHPDVDPEWTWDDCYRRLTKTCNE